MKDKCDNNCATCPMQTQVHCTLFYAKANNASVGALAERIEALEARLATEQPSLLMPTIDPDSANLPAQQQEETLNPLKPL